MAASSALAESSFQVVVHVPGARTPLVSTLKCNNGRYLAFRHAEGSHAGKFDAVPAGEFRLQVELPSGAYALKTLRIGPDAAKDGVVNVTVEEDEFLLVKDRLERAHGVDLDDLRVSDKARKHFDRAWKAMSASRWEEARKRLDQAVDASPDYFDAWLNRGVVARKQGDFRVAEQSFQEALRIRPESFEAAFNLAAILEDSGRPQEALGLARMAFHIRPEDPMANAQLGAMLFRAGKHQQAIPMLTLAAEKDPLSPYGPHLILALALEREGKAEEAAEQLRDWLRHYPNHEDRAVVEAKRRQLLQQGSGTMARRAGSAQTPSPR